MAYTNSPLVNYTKISPCQSGARNHTIDRITPHCVVGQLSVETMGAWFGQPSTKASANYGIGEDARVGMYVEEKDRSWCSSSSENDNRAVTIECASDMKDPYAFRAIVYEKLITLCADVCRRNGKTKLLWLGDKNATMNYQPAPDEMILTVHRWFAAKACPGDWLMARMGELAIKVTALIGGVIMWYRVGTGWEDGKCVGQVEADLDLNIAKATADRFGYKVYDWEGVLVYAAQPVPGSGSTQAKSIHALVDEKAKAAAMLELVHNTDKSGILPSVTTAQMILESGYCGTDLALNANNCFGMKENLSGNTWPGSTWDGKSIYPKQTQEDDGRGNYYWITANFRKYACVEDSIGDHSAYLLGAMNGSKKRYAGLTDTKDYKEAITIIKNGGYATDTRYIAKICDIIQRFGLDKYDKQVTPTPAPDPEPQPAPTPAPATVKYKVQYGAFKSQNGAQTKQKTLADAGIKDTMITDLQSDGYYRILSKKDYDTEAAARKVANKQKKATGFNTTVKKVDA